MEFLWITFGAVGFWISFAIGWNLRARMQEILDKQKQEVENNGNE